MRTVIATVLVALALLAVAAGRPSPPATATDDACWRAWETRLASHAPHVHEAFERACPPSSR